jgi:hydroxymethylbilane synthase
MKLKIGTRGSSLALTQSRWVKSMIEAQHPDVSVELIKITTKGDKITDSALNKIGGKGLFVKEIEDALLRKDVDLAVHSIKDVPGDLPERLCLAVFSEREDPRDAFISKEYASIYDLPEGASVGTGSLRRSSQLLNIRPDLKIIPMRGNVDTRMKKIETGEFQAIILAMAGLKRLGLSGDISRPLPIDECIPAIGQGALGLETREGDSKVLGIINFLNHRETELTVRAERAFLKRLEGGCQVPIAGFAVIGGASIRLRGMVAELDGTRIIRDEVTGPEDKPEELGTALAERLLKAGAEKILAAVYAG